MGLKDIAVAKSAAMIQGADFAYCTAQADVAILEQVKESRGWVFNGCSLLKRCISTEAEWGGSSADREFVIEVCLYPLAEIWLRRNLRYYGAANIRLSKRKILNIIPLFPKPEQWNFLGQQQETDCKKDTHIISLAELRRTVSERRPRH